MKQLHWIFLTLSIGCGGLQTTESDCEKGFDRADDGACYPSGGGGLSGGLDDDGDGGIDADGGDDGPADGSTGDDGAGDDGAGDGAPPDGGPPADEGPPDEGTDGGPMDEGPSDEGPSDEGPMDEGPSDDGPSDDGPSDDGPSDDGPSDDGGDVGEPFVDCESNADCTMDDCPDGSMGCECLIEAGFCVPTCDTDADCVEEGFVCEDIGICGPDE